jgi:hypothetical protein
MSQNAYTRIALRLRNLSPDDREWLLAQLAPEDCRRVSEALREHRAQASSARSINPPRVEEGFSPVARLTAAPAARVQALLAEQPDWAIALLLSTDSWPWAEEFLDELVPERLSALRALASELAPRVKPKVRQAVVHTIASRIQPPATVLPATRAFDAALERALDDLPVFKHWSSERA